MASRSPSMALPPAEFNENLPIDLKVISWIDR
jgi:hypothetical protein